MDHRIKTFAFKLLQALPRTQGDRAYHWLQTLKQQTLTAEIESQESTIIKFAAEVDKLGLSFRKKTIVEIGSGWLPIAPYLLLFKHQAARVLTIDNNRHYRDADIGRLNRYFEERFEVSFPEGRSLHPAVSYFPLTNLLDHPIGHGTTQVVISRNVLEHVTPADLEAMHRKAYSFLEKDSFIIHQISPSDHRAYSDKNLSLWDFLQYAPEEWDRIQTRFDYHNRLRLPQYLAVFKKCGFEVRCLRYEGAQGSPKLPENIHPDYAGFSNEELTAGSIVVILVPAK